MSNLYNSPTTPAPKPQRPWFKKKRVWAGVFVGLVVLGSIVDNGDAEPVADDPKPAVTVTETATPTATKEAEPAVTEEPSKAPTKEPVAEEAELEPVPDVVGMSVSEAISALHDSGYLADEESISPGNTFIIMNSNWKVCRQDPGPGATDDIRVTIYAVKMHESC